MDNAIYSQLKLVEYKINNDGEYEYKGIVQYMDSTTDDIIEANNIFCKRLVDNLTQELAEWHFTQNIPLATFYYNEDKTDLYLKTPYSKFLEYDDETNSNSDLVIEFFNGSAITNEVGDIIFVDDLE